MERSQVLAHRHKKLQQELYGKEPKTVDDIFEMVKVLVNKNVSSNGTELVSMRFEVGYSNKVQSTHSCTLFERLYHDTKAKPGFDGRIWLRFTRSPKGFGSENMFGTATWTGSGGGGWNEPWDKIVKLYYKAPKHIQKQFTNPYCLGYGYKFYLADFPDLEKDIKQQKIIAQLKDEKFEYKFQKTWISLKQLEKDNRFADLCVKTSSRRNLNLDYT